MQIELPNKTQPTNAIGLASHILWLDLLRLQASRGYDGFITCMEGAQAIKVQQRQCKEHVRRIKRCGRFQGHVGHEGREYTMAEAMRRDLTSDTPYTSSRTRGDD